LNDLEKNIFILLKKEFLALKLLNKDIGKIQDWSIRTYDREKQSVHLLPTIKPYFEFLYSRPEKKIKGLGNTDFTAKMTLDEIDTEKLFRPHNISKTKKLSMMILESKNSIAESRFKEIENNFITYCATLVGYRTISLLRKDLIRLLNEIVKAGDAFNSSILHELIDYYNYEKFKYDGFTQIQVGKNNIILDHFQIEEKTFLPSRETPSPEALVDYLAFDDYWGEIYKYFIIYFTIENLNSKQFRDRLRKCQIQKCAKFFIATKADKRIKYCPDCSRKSKMSKEARRKYHQEYRRKKRQEKLAIEREEKINSYIKAGYSRNEAIELIEDDSKL
jgi:hypothetical protein